MKSAFMLAVGAGASVVAASPVTIDFEGIGNHGDSIPANQFASQGVTWVDGDLFRELTAFGDVFEGHVGEFSARNNVDEIEFTISQDMQSFSANVATAFGSAHIEFYLDGSLAHDEFIGFTGLGSNGLSKFIPVALSGFNFDQVRFLDGGPGDSLLMDDIQMDPAGSVVPLPSASALAGLGLLGLGVRRRRGSL